MARNNDRDRDRDRKRAPREPVRRTKVKPCAFCGEHVAWVDYKDVATLRRYMSDRGKIRARRVSGNCVQHQRAVAVAIKTARELALLPFTQRTVSDRPGGGRGRSGRAQGGERRSAPAPSEAGVPEATGDALAGVSSVAGNDADGTQA
jgi:small subunit ribosomal protein S18